MLTNVFGDTWGENGFCTTCPLVWEIQFKKCQLGFRSFWGTADLGPSARGDFRMNVYLYKKGDAVPPDYATGLISDPSNPNYGELKPGWYYFNPADDDMLLMQVRLQHTRGPLGSVTPNGVINVIPCDENMDC